MHQGLMGYKAKRCHGLWPWSAIGCHGSSPHSVGTLVALHHLRIDDIGLKVELSSNKKLLRVSFSFYNVTMCLSCEQWTPSETFFNRTQAISGLLFDLVYPDVSCLPNKNTPILWLTHSTQVAKSTHSSHFLRLQCDWPSWVFCKL